MTVKICGNNILYWGTVGLLFFHDKLTDIEFMAAVRPDLERIWAITRQLEAMYREWNAVDSREWRRAIVPTAAFPGMFQRHVDMAGGFDDETLKSKLASTADLMEAMAVIVFHRAAQALPDAPGRGREDQPVCREPRPRPLGGRRPLQRRGALARRGASDAGGGDREPVHGGRRAACVTALDSVSSAIRTTIGSG